MLIVLEKTRVPTPGGSQLSITPTLRDSLLSWLLWVLTCTGELIHIHKAHAYMEKTLKTIFKYLFLHESMIKGILVGINTCMSYRAI